jgi:hypothetical protein
MRSRFMFLVGMFFAFVMACGTKAAPPPVVVAAAPPPPPRAHQADAPAHDPLAPSGDVKGNRLTPAFELPKGGEWVQLPAGTVPPPWKYAFINVTSEARVQVDIDIGVQPSPLMASEVQSLAKENGLKYGPLTPIAGADGAAFTVNDGNNVFGKVAFREMGNTPGACVIEFWGRWPKSADAAMITQFDFIVVHTVVSKDAAQ